MYTDMGNWAEIRRRVLVDGLSKRAACREYDIHWDTPAKILAHPEPPGYRRAAPRPRPKLGPFLPVIRQILEGDRKAPPKQRHTVNRIHQRLRDEHRYDGGLTIIEVAVAARRRGRPRSSCRWPTAPGRPRSTSARPRSPSTSRPTKVALFVMTLPYSDAIFCCAFPRECTEAFLEGHARAFAFFGGVPRRISYDNLKIAVARIIGGRGRKLTAEFLRLKSHHLFESHFCLVRRPNEKGHVEVLVGYAWAAPSWSRCPRPAAAWGRSTPTSRARCRADLARRPWGKPASKADLLEEERPALAAAAGRGVRGARVEATVRRLVVAGPLRRQAQYSVPTGFAHRRVTVVGTVDARSGSSRATRVVATHSPVPGPRVAAYDPVHYLAVLELHSSGALDFAAPPQGWVEPVCFGVLAAPTRGRVRRGEGRGSPSRPSACWSGPTPAS